jgi:hypothetical protein
LLSSFFPDTPLLSKNSKARFESSMTATPSILPAPPPAAAVAAVDLQSLVHKSLAGSVPFVAFPVSFQALSVLQLHGEIYAPDSEFLSDFLYGLKAVFFAQGTDYQSFLSDSMSGRVLLDTKGVWIATSDAQRRELYAYLESIRRLHDLAFRQAYGEVPPEWLFPVFFGPGAMPLPLSSLPTVSWWPVSPSPVPSTSPSRFAPDRRRSASPSTAVQHQTLLEDHPSDTESMAS